MMSMFKQLGLRLGAASLALSLTVSPSFLASTSHAQDVFNAKRGAIPQLRSSLTNASSQIELTLGKAKVVNLDMPANRVAISNPDVVGIVMISPTQVQLVGKTVGSANLLVWSNETGENTLSIDISVHRDVTVLSQKLKLVDPGLQVQPIAAEDTIILTGTVENPERAQLAYDMAKAFLSSGNAPAPAATGQTIPSTSSGSGTFAPNAAKIINLIKIKGQESTKSELVQARLKDIDPNINLRVVPGFNNAERAILSGRVKDTSVVAKAVNLTALFYGEPGIKIIAGQGGNVNDEAGVGGATAGGQQGGQSTGNFAPDEVKAGLISNFAKNILYGSIITDKSGNVISMLDVEQRPIVRCKIMFLEVRKDRGFSSNNTNILQTGDVKAVTHGGALAPTGASSTPLGFFSAPVGTAFSQLGYFIGSSEFAGLLSAAATSGDARVLAEPTISTISGEPGSFLAGGEFPVPVLGTNGQIIVVFKQFGIRLQLQPTVTDRGTVHLQVTPEVSTLDPTAGITLSGITIPGLRTRRSQAVVEIKDGGYFALGGLYNDTETDTYTKTPFLGQLPILGSLFRSQNFQRQKTELIIVIHPEIQHDMDMSELEATADQSADEVGVRSYTQDQVNDWVKTTNGLKQQSTIFGLRHRKREKEMNYAANKVVTGLEPKPVPHTLSPSMNPNPRKRQRVEIMNEEQD